MATTNPLLLLLRLDAPLQSWGTHGRWDDRDSGTEPSKSGIVGLLACSLGYPRGDSRIAELANTICIGVRVEEEGTIIDDFHTVSGEFATADGHSREDTIVSHRAYLADASFLVAIGGSEDTLNQCKDGLQRPAWQGYLGRKSCPPCRPILESTTREYASVEDALRQHPWQGKASAKRPQTARCVIDDARGNLVQRDAVAPPPGRRYYPRHARAFSVAIPRHAKSPGLVTARQEDSQ